jgi:predicted restriction endonuclease
LKVLSDVRSALEEYPVLDETDYYERESEYISETFETYKDEYIENAIENLKTKTAIPTKLLEKLERSSAFETIVSEAYRYDCGYCGAEEGSITKRNFHKCFEEIHSDCWANTDVQALSNQIAEAFGV